jgi:ABC-type amino acid transport substrate-binding protein
MRIKALCCFFYLLVPVLFSLPHLTCAASQQHPDFLTVEERRWLAEHPVLRVGVGVAFPPYQWVEQENTAPVFKGVVSDYVKILEDRLHIKLQIVFGIPFNQALERGKQGEIDLFPCLAATAERETFLLFTSPYISYPSVIITKENAPFIGGLEDLRGRKVAAVKGQVVHTKLTKDYPHLQLDLLETENAEKDLEAVSFGRADACIMDLGVASHLIQKLRLTNLKVAAPTDLGKIELAMGVRKDWPILQSILEKSLRTIDGKTKDDINQQWIRLKYQPGISPEVVLRWGGILGITILVIFALQFFWNRRLQREIAERKQIEKERNALIEKLQNALSEVKTLQGFLPICASCQKIRTDSGYWQQIEAYIQENTDAQFSHGICPECIQTLYPGMAEKILENHEPPEKVGKESIL